MFDHVTLRVSDRPASERFYRTALDALGVAQDRSGAEFAEWSDFSLAAAERPEAVTEHLHVGFVAPTRQHVDRFWRAGVEAGYRDDGEPGPRPQYRDEYYGAFLLDPDGNSVEAVHHDLLRRGGVIDHLWIRVGDVAAAKAFYELLAPHASLRLRRNLPDRVQFAAGGESRGSFSLVGGSPTSALHMAFGASSDAAVDAFHEALVGAGYTSNGAPGERGIYQPGYYAAFVLDPDANNIELVNHNRPAR